MLESNNFLKINVFELSVDVKEDFTVIYKLSPISSFESKVHNNPVDLLSNGNQYFELKRYKQSVLTILDKGL